MSFGVKEDRYAEEEVVSQGQSMADAIRQIGVGEVTFYIYVLISTEN